MREEEEKMVVLFRFGWVSFENMKEEERREIAKEGWGVNLSLKNKR